VKRSVHRGKKRKSSKKKERKARPAFRKKKRARKGRSELPLKKGRGGWRFFRILAGKKSQLSGGARKKASSPA